MAPDLFIPLHYTPGASGVYVCALNGQAEVYAADGTTPAVLHWLNRLLSARTEDGNPLGAEELAAADRDRILAAIYRREYGDRVGNTVTCPYCEKPYDFRFSLEGLMEHIYRQGDSQLVVSIGKGVYRSASGALFRLPTGSDELAVSVLPVAEREQGLLSRCVVGGEKPPDGVEIEAAMQEVGPLLETELVARCVECGKEQGLYFNIQSLLFSRLMRGRREVVRQVHLLARAYGWTRADILALSREERKAYATLIEQDRG